MKDVLGQEIKVGDCVTHGVRDGNSGAHRIGIVFDITPQNKLKVAYPPINFRGDWIQDKAPTKTTLKKHNGVVVNIDGLEGTPLLQGLQELRERILGDV